MDTSDCLRWFWEHTRQENVVASPRSRLCGPSQLGQPRHEQLNACKLAIDIPTAPIKRINRRFIRRWSAAGGGSTKSLECPPSEIELCVRARGIMKDALRRSADRLRLQVGWHAGAGGHGSSSSDGQPSPLRSLLELPSQAMLAICICMLMASTLPGVTYYYVFLWDTAALGPFAWGHWGVVGAAGLTGLLAHGVGNKGVCATKGCIFLMLTACTLSSPLHPLHTPSPLPTRTPQPDAPLPVAPPQCSSRPTPRCAACWRPPWAASTPPFGTR